MDQLEDITLQAGALTLAGLAGGPRDGRRLLALHGWLDNAASFAGLAPHLDEVRLVALDFPGHGRSEHRHGSAEYHYVNYVADVHAAVETLGWDEFDLLGHSMGAGVAALYAGTFPERIGRLALIEGLGPFTTAPEDAPENLGRALAARARVGHREPRVYPDLETACSRRATATPDMAPSSVETIVGRGTVEVDGGVRFSHDLRLRARSLLRFTEEQVMGFLGNITAPAAVIKAGDGLDYADDVMRRRFERLQDGTLHQIAGGHHVHLDHPERVAPILREHFELDG